MDPNDEDESTEAGAQRARLYRVMADTLERQTSILAQVEKDLRDRPTKSQGLKWLAGGLALVFIVVVAMFTSVIRLQTEGRNNGRIIRAATGCEQAQTVKACQITLKTQQSKQLEPFLRLQDCWTRRALAHLPPPPRYDVPCVLPQGGN
jgi:hypothetical protein